MGNDLHHVSVISPDSYLRELSSRYSALENIIFDNQEISAFFVILTYNHCHSVTCCPGHTLSGSTVPCTKSCNQTKFGQHHPQSSAESVDTWSCAHAIASLITLSASLRISSEISLINDFPKLLAHQYSEPSNSVRTPQ